MNNKELSFHIGSFFRDLKRFLKERKNARKQKTFCWCPICGEDLCSNNSFKEDTDLVRYDCCNCNCRSAWDFDAPAPILIKCDGISYDKNI